MVYSHHPTSIFTYIIPLLLFIRKLPNLKSLILHGVDLVPFWAPTESEDKATLAMNPKLRSFSATGFFKWGSSAMRNFVLTASALEKIRLWSIERPANNSPVAAPTDEEDSVENNLPDYLKRLVARNPDLSHLGIVEARSQWPRLDYQTALGEVFPAKINVSASFIDGSNLADTCSSAL